MAQNISENFNRLSRVHERYRQTEDRRTDDDIANVNSSSRSLKIGVSLQRGQFDPKISRRRGRPNNYFCTVSQANECLTTLLLTVFTERNFVADFLQAKCVLDEKWPFCVFEKRLGTTKDVASMRQDEAMFSCSTIRLTSILSERELKFMFATSSAVRLSVCLSVCHLSVVCL